MSADDTRHYLSRMESRHEDLLINLLERLQKAEQKHAQVIRKLEGDLLIR